MPWVSISHASRIIGNHSLALSQTRELYSKQTLAGLSPGLVVGSPGSRWRIESSLQAGSAQAVSFRELETRRHEDRWLELDTIWLALGYKGPLF